MALWLWEQRGLGRQKKGDNRDLQCTPLVLISAYQEQRLGLMKCAIEIEGEKGVNREFRRSVASCIKKETAPPPYLHAIAHLSCPSMCVQQHFVGSPLSIVRPTILTLVLPLSLTKCVG
ncbi:hypothetical protein Syun_025435 [Stephania yunnanensis]|uniref:Uncharacterized protein n=1 Tax=Stephania yunnanensis TaxID=152371 RepID=A0AAP0EU98_9MAGN